MSQVRTRPDDTILRFDPSEWTDLCRPPPPKCSQRQDHKGPFRVVARTEVSISSASQRRDLRLVSEQIVPHSARLTRDLDVDTRDNLKYRQPRPDESLRSRHPEGHQNSSRRRFRGSSRDTVRSPGSPSSPKKVRVLTFPEIPFTLERSPRMIELERYSIPRGGSRNDEDPSTDESKREDTRNTQRKEGSTEDCTKESTR